ncbi:MAG TPA: glycoside hydrolase family 9 protein [Kofleriaceae bacterium]|nr:glycoside hydrolase family 9 protein [Kofleriaceae bacterium]
MKTQLAVSRLVVCVVVGHAVALAGACQMDAESPGEAAQRATGAPARATALRGDDVMRHRAAPALSPFIVVDQFGYLPDAEKIAVARDPVTGFDGAEEFVPGARYAVVCVDTGGVVARGAPVAWSGGAEDGSSGDRAWRFDFSVVTREGDYYVLDETNNVRSAVFRIDDDVYRDVLRAATRAFFYQRAGTEKTAELAGEGWADGASHVGPLQDGEARRYDAAGDATTARDVHGGWYDAGDYNKYTSWHARYVVSLLRAYREAPGAFGDDTGVPESGNGVPDILDEALFGLDWLSRMQNPDGSVLSIVGEASASPPSAATGPSLYGTASTSATLSSAAAFAFGATVLGDVSGLADRAGELAARAEQAFAWADANPGVLFFNNDAGSGTQGLGAGQQETDDYGRLTRKVEAAVYLFEATGQEVYRQFVDGNYAAVHLVLWHFAYPFEPDEQEMLLHYAALPSATPAVAGDIRAIYLEAMDRGDNFPAQSEDRDPYFAFLGAYTWGSNRSKSSQGNMFLDLESFAVPGADPAAARAAAARYLHYIHGVNPLGLVYLSNMGALGAESSVNEFYHSWFANGSALWDRVGTSTFGPPPGFLTGGPNPSYDVDGCCPASCGSPENNALCSSEPLEPPRGQPAQKSYKDFNTSWPLDSWSVTENSNGYQVAYIRLVSKFVTPE